MSLEGELDRGTKLCGPPLDQMHPSTRCPVGMQHGEGLVTVPFGWKRVVSNGKVVYMSPSDVRLHSLEEAAAYLQTEGTCKCGLRCPLRLHQAFNFSPTAPTRSDLPWDGCCHRRTPKKEAILTNKRKRPKGKSRSPFDSVLVSQLLAQRDKLGQKKEKNPGAIKLSFSDNQQMKTALKSENIASVRGPIVKGTSRTVGFVLEEMNKSANLHLNQNFYDPVNQDKKGCLQQENPSIVFHEHMNTSLPCLVQDVTRERVDPQTFGPTANQGVFNPHQFLHNGTNITLNCNFSSSGQIFSTQLPLNSCIEMNATPVSSSAPGAFLLPAESQQHMSNSLMTNFIHSGQSFTTHSQDTLRHPRDPGNSRQKSKKATSNRAKINSVLDRGSPCPNIDVRQIPSEHHRPPPEAFAAISSSSVGPISQASSSPFPPDLGLSYMKQSFQNGQNKPLRTVSQNSILYDDSKTPDSTGSNNSSPFQVCQSINKNFQMNSFQFQDPSQFNQANSSYPAYENNRNQKMSIQSMASKTPPTSQTLNSQANMAMNVPTSKVIETRTPDNSQSVENRSSPYISSPYNTIKNSQNVDIKPSVSIPSTVYLPMSSVGSHCPPTSAIMSVALGNSSPNPISVLSNSHSFYNGSSQPNIINIPVSYASQQSHLNSINTVFSSQNVPHTSQQGITMTQQPIVYNHPMQGRSDQAIVYGGSHRGDSFFVQEVQQVLGQKDYSGLFQPRTVQQMMLPASNPQQLLQVRMSGSGGLITMLPTSSGMMNGTQVLAANAQQIGNQMVLSDRPNMVNQQGILQNNCFIMSNQPSFVARPPGTNIVSCCQVPTSVSLSSGNYCTSQNASCTPMLTAPLMHKNSSDPQHGDVSMQNDKEQGFASGFHILQSTLQRPKVDSADIGQDNWVPKSEFKGEGVGQVSGTFLGNVSTSRSNSVPSNMSGHALLSSCGQVLINSDNNSGMHPQNASSLSSMASVIPIIGGQCAPMPPLSVPNVTAVTTTMTQMIPAIGIAPQILGQPVQPMVQVINTVPFNSMQNAVLVPGGSNVLSQTMRLDTLQASPVVGTPAQTVFNVIPPPPVGCLTSPSLRLPGGEVAFEGPHDTPASSSSDTHGATFRAPSPAVRKRGRDGRRKANSQTVASMLQHGTHHPSPTSNQASQQPSLQQPFLQTLTVLPQRPLLQPPVVNYGSHQILTAGPLGIVQPLGMLGVLQNIPVPHFQSLSVLPHAEQQSDSMQMHSAFAAGSIVPNVVATNPVMTTHVSGTEVLVTSRSHTVPETPVSGPFLPTIPLPPVAQSLSCTTGSVRRSGHSRGSLLSNAMRNGPTLEVSLASRHGARSIGVQSNGPEQNAAVQTVTSSTAEGGRSSRDGAEGEGSSTLLLSGGESCESPWPDPVNLSAAVRAVVQEQADSNEGLSSPQQTPTSSIGEGGSVLDLSAEGSVDWPKGGRITESTSTASSESSEPTSTDCNVTSDSGVESSQEPMNLACMRENDGEWTDPYEDRHVVDDRLAGRRGPKQDEESDDDTLPLLPRTFNEGDLVWGQIRGFPSWPGKLVGRDEDGKLLVRWFGDHTFAQVDPDQLKTLSEGLEAHHRARRRHRRGRRMNAQLENAIQEAMLELDTKVR